MKTIPPAETFIINKLDEKYPNENRPPSPKDVEEWLIEFAKMHVTEALKYACEKVTMKIKHNIDELDMMDDWIEVDKNSIVNSYPLDNVE